MTTVEKYIDSFNTKFESFLTGCDSVEEMGLWDRETLGEMDAFYVNDLLSVIIRLIASDGNISAKEVQYLNETFGFAYTQEELVAVYNSCQEDIGHAFDESFQNGISYMRKINGKLADAYKELLALSCRIIVEGDGVVAPEEIAEIRCLMAMCE